MFWLWDLIWCGIQYQKSVAMMKIEIWISLICIYQGKFEMYSAKYLGHIIYNEMSDDDYMHRQRRKLYAQANMLMRQFYMCSDQVKINLFRAYCTSFVLLPCVLSLRKRAYVSLRQRTMTVWGSCWKNQDGVVQVIYSVRQECNDSLL